MNFTQGSFCKHLIDAIDINKTRKPIYAAMTQGHSCHLSNLLIWNEYLILPIAWCFDIWAKKFHRQGINIVSKDFVSMANILPAEASPKYRKKASKKTLQELKSSLLEYKKEGFISLKKCDLKAIYKISRQILDLVHKKAQQEKVHFAMTQHLLESIAFATQNGLIYAEQSGGKTLRLSKKLIAVQFHVVDKSLFLDKMAHPFHALGCGILVNDVPLIPLENPKPCLSSEQLKKFP